MAIALLFACEEVEREPIVVLGDAAEFVSPSMGASLVFEKLDAEVNTLTFTWSKADFGFQSATTYSLELDYFGNDFADPISLISTSDTSATFTQAELNEEFLEFGLETSKPTELEFRIVASINVDVEMLYSTSINLNVTLFASTFPPIYIIGGCTGGWDPGKAVEVVSTGEAYMYTTIAEFTNDGDINFRFFTAPDWDASLGGHDIFTTYPNDLLEIATADSDPNFNFIGTPGWYELNVNTNTGVLVMTAIDKPVMYVTGDATHGWVWDDPVTELLWTGYKVWEGDVDFTNGNAFRLFPQKDWGPDSYGWDLLVNYNTDYIDVMADHDDPNWQFLAPTGTYHMKVDMRAASVEITE
jgi:hypothetical protein